MSALKDRISADFVSAMKEKNAHLKSTLGMIKTKITEMEKKDGKEITDDGVIAVISSYNKQLDQTISQIESNPLAAELVEKTKTEKLFIAEYLPKQITDDELLHLIDNFISTEDKTNTKLFGKVMGYLSSNFKSRYDSKRAKEIFDQLVK